MPQYAFLLNAPLETASLPDRLAALRTVGVPYSDEQIENAADDARGQAYPDTDRAYAVEERYGEATNIRFFDGRRDRLTEMDALVAYLQIMGGLTDLPQKTQIADGE